jgi:hypothetical protein
VEVEVQFVLETRIHSIVRYISTDVLRPFFQFIVESKQELRDSACSQLVDGSIPIALGSYYSRIGRVSPRIHALSKRPASVASPRKHESWRMRPSLP